MHLEYSILWFEDQPGEIVPSRRRIERHIKKNGFIPNIIQEVNGDNIDELAKNHAKLRDIDLVLVDYDLGQGNEPGDTIAKKISNNFPVEILFYSGSAPGELRKKVCESKIDGVFCGHRNDLADNTIEIIDYSLRKFTDLNNFRGIVAGSVAEFDHLMKSIVENHHKPLNTDDKGKHIAKIKQRLVKSAKSNLKQCETLSDNEKIDLSGLMKHRAFTSDIRLRTTQRAMEKATLSDAQNEIFSKIRDMLTLRNDLSHIRAISDEKGTRLEIEKEVFTDKEFTEIRKDLQRHHSNLKSILNKIKPDDD